MGAALLVIAAIGTLYLVTPTVKPPEQGTKPCTTEQVVSMVKMKYTDKEINKICFVEKANEVRTDAKKESPKK